MLIKQSVDTCIVEILSPFVILVAKLRIEF